MGWVIINKLIFIAFDFLKISFYPYHFGNLGARTGLTIRLFSFFQDLRCYSQLA